MHCLPPTPTPIAFCSCNIGHVIFKPKEKKEGGEEGSDWLFMKSLLSPVQTGRHWEVQHERKSGGYAFRKMKVAEQEVFLFYPLYPHLLILMGLQRKNEWTEMIVYLRVFVPLHQWAGWWDWQMHLGLTLQLHCMDLVSIPSPRCCEMHPGAVGAFAPVKKQSAVALSRSVRSASWFRRS